MGEGRTKKHLNKKRLTAVVAALLTIAVLVTGIPLIRAWADFDESRAVRFRAYKNSHTIDNSVLFIGTHLIHLQALTDELYEKAVQSQTDSGQDEIYYKSELADGVWFNITDASALSAITSEGTPVQESELDDLFVTNYTGRDGLTLDAKSGSVVCIFDDPDPYDLMKLPELEPIRRIYQDKYLQTDSQNKSFQYLKDSMTSFFTQNMRNEKTDEYDRMMEHLQKCYESFCVGKMDEEAQIVMTLMEGIDAARRSYVLERLLGDVDLESDMSGELSGGETMTDPVMNLGTVSEIVNGEHYEAKTAGTEEEEESVDPFNLDTTLVEGVMNSISQCNQSNTTYNAKMLSPGGSAVRAYIYEQSRQLVDRCGSSDSMATDRTIVALVNNIKYAQNIENGIVADADGELKLINEQFLPAAENSFSSQLSKGESQQYQAIAKESKSDATKKAILDKDQIEVEIARSELESMIRAKTQRMQASDALKYVYECIAWTQEREKKIKKDDFANTAKESSVAHIEWLRTLAQKIVASDASLMSELERLKALLADYQQKQQEALDEDNLNLAAQYGTLVTDTSNRIAAEEARLNDIINSETSTEAEKAQAQVALGQSGLFNDIDKLSQQAMSALNSGTTDGLEAVLDMLGTLGAENALLKIKDACKDSNLSSSAQAKLEQKIDDAVASSKESSLHDQANAAGTGSGTEGAGGAGSGMSNPATMSEQTLKNAISQILGSPFEMLDAKGKIAAAAAMDRVYDNYSNVNAKALAKQFITTCATERSPFVYKKLEGHSETEYISLEVIGNSMVTPYRYVYSDFREEATLTHGVNTYRFRVGARVVTLADLTRQPIDKYKVEFQGVPYIDEATAKTYFDCEAEYIADTDYSACMDKTIREKADELYSALTGQ